MGLEHFRKKIFAWVMLGSMGTSVALSGKVHHSHHGNEEEDVMVVAGTPEQIKHTLSNDKILKIHGYKNIRDAMQIIPIEMKRNITIRGVTFRQHSPDFSTVIQVTSDAQLQKDLQVDLEEKFRLARNELVAKATQTLEEAGFTPAQIRQLGEYAVEEHVDSITINVKGIR